MMVLGMYGRYDGDIGVGSLLWGGEKMGSHLWVLFSVSRLPLQVPVRGLHVLGCSD